MNKKVLLCLLVGINMKNIYKRRTYVSKKSKS